MNNKLLFLGGILTILLGLDFFYSGAFCYYFDTYCTEMKFNRLAGVITACIGLFMIAIAFRKGQRDYKETFICPQCETAHPFAEVQDEMCPQCKTKMEPLKGFYERHPDLKDD